MHRKHIAAGSPILGPDGLDRQGMVLAAAMRRLVHREAGALGAGRPYRSLRILPDTHLVDAGFPKKR